MQPFLHVTAINLIRDRGRASGTQRLVAGNDAAPDGAIAAALCAYFDFKVVQRTPDAIIIAKSG